jgi:hypothetical protein
MTHNPSSGNLPSLTPEAIQRAILNESVTMPRLLIASLTSYALAGPTNDASAEARDRIVAEVRAILNEPVPDAT